MKKFKLIAVLSLLFCGAALSAQDFDWSECWCNYGGGIKQGDIIVHAAGGLWYGDFAYAAYNDYWFLPPVMVEVQYAQPIWKLPFTFGGFAGFRAYGYKYDYWNASEGKYEKRDSSYWGVFFGGEAAYHIQLPPKGLDLYAVTRVGLSIPFVKPSENWVPDYFQMGEAFGANWFFNDFIGLNLEFGFPFSKFGVALHF
jgi:hypothetical protein